MNLTITKHLSQLFSINAQDLIQGIVDCKKELEALFSYYEEFIRIPENKNFDITKLPTVPVRYNDDQLFSHTSYRSQAEHFIVHDLPLVMHILNTTANQEEKNYNSLPLEELLQMYKKHSVLLQKTKQFRKTIIIYHQLFAINTLQEQFATFSETEDTELKEKVCKKLGALHQYILTKGSALRHDTKPYFQNTHPHQGRGKNSRFKHTYSEQIDHTIIPYIAEQIAELKSLLTHLRTK